MSGERGPVLGENHSIHRLHLKHSAEKEKITSIIMQVINWVKMTICNIIHTVKPVLSSHSKFF